MSATISTSITETTITAAVFLETVILVLFSRIPTPKKSLYKYYIFYNVQMSSDVNYQKRPKSHFLAKLLFPVSVMVLSHCSVVFARNAEECSAAIEKQVYQH